MPHKAIPDGLHLLKQPCRQKAGIYHYGVLDAGNRLRLDLANPSEPLLIHQTPPFVQVSRFRGTGVWEVVGVVRLRDESQAIARLHQALQDPTYDLFGHNCEHFARFVVTGVRESKQVQTALAIAGIGALLIAAAREAA